MGYMVFGMRKENYTRKPKKAFKILKKVYGQKPDFPKSNLPKSNEVPISYEKHTYKPFYKSKIYRILRICCFIIIGISIVWAVFLQEPYDNYRKEKFEEENFRELYIKDLKYLAPLFHQIEQISGKFISAEYYKWSGKYDLRIQHPSVDTSKVSGKVFNLGFNGGYGTKRVANHDKIIDGKLIKAGFDHHPYNIRWIYNLSGVQANQIPESVASFLDMDAAEFTRFLALIHKFGHKIENDNGLIYADYYHDEFGYYKIVYSRNEFKSTTEMRYGDTYLNLVGNLSENIYWTRQEKVELRE
ncbi:hypothetical protein [Reichenbachiella sp.]|uniref:hypothetical protein n=1 Tax=Reichenbachiella sp. TaxID=2184521 RepID=UPI003B5BB674